MSAKRSSIARWIGTYGSDESFCDLLFRVRAHVMKEAIYVILALIAVGSAYAGEKSSPAHRVYGRPGQPKRQAALHIEHDLSREIHLGCRYEPFGMPAGQHAHDLACRRNDPTANESNFTPLTGLRLSHSARRN